MESALARRAVRSTDLCQKDAGGGGEQLGGKQAFQAKDQRGLSPRDKTQARLICMYLDASRPEAQLSI